MAASSSEVTQSDRLIGINNGEQIEVMKVKSSRLMCIWVGGQTQKQI